MYTADVNAEDVLIAHDNGEAIREANGNSPTATKLKAATVNQAFDIETKVTGQIDLEDSIAEVQAEAFVEEEEEELDEVEDEIEVEDSTFEL